MSVPSITNRILQVIVSSAVDTGYLTSVCRQMKNLLKGLARHCYESESNAAVCQTVEKRKILSGLESWVGKTETRDQLVMFG